MSRSSTITDDEVEPGKLPPIHPGEFDNFLTARFRLYTTYAKRIAYAQIEHKPWPLHTAKIMELEQNLVQRSRLLNPEVHLTDRP